MESEQRSHSVVNPEQMKMEARTSRILCCDDYTKDLEYLLDTFGSAVSLDDIACAYCQAGRDVYKASEMLANLHDSTSSILTSAFKDQLEGASSYSGWSAELSLERSETERNLRFPRPKKNPVSMGTVSCVIGKDYARHRPLNFESRGVSKPPKISLDEFPTSETWNDEGTPDIHARTETMSKDVEQFLFSMLGGGFQLDKNVIREVLGLCGYDLEKSVEKLLVLSTSTWEKSDDYFGLSAQKAMEKCPNVDSAESGKVRNSLKNELELSKRDRDRYDLQKQVLESLFSVPERLEEPQRICRPKEVRRSRVFGEVVVEPLRDTIVEHRSAPAKQQVADEEEEENEDSYKVLRKAVSEHWFTMKEYYKSATDAFASGNHDQAYSLLDKGHLFMRMAREADEKSAQKILETRKEEEVVCLDLHCHDPKGAISLLKSHLSNISGIPSIQYLKLLVGTCDPDTKEGAKKRLIKKLLERESITWTEQENGQSMIIRVDKINPTHLSFAR